MEDNVKAPSVVLQFEASATGAINDDKEDQNWHRKCCQIGSRLHSSLSKVFPILEWAPNYRREWAWSDLIAGLTLVSLHIPQAIAYARLAGVPPIHGLYVSIIPALIYALMGTSRQISIGTFAVASIACRDIVTKFEDTNNLTSSPISPEKSIEILCTLAFLVGLIQLIVGVLKLGALKALLSDALISAFVGASTLHVLTSQIGTLVGLDESIKRRSGIFSLVRTWYSFMENILTANLFTAILSAFTLTVLWMTKEYFESYISKKFSLKNVIIPIDILCIITLVTASHLFDFNGKYGVELVSSISNSVDVGLGSIPKMIHFEYIPHLLSSAIVLSLIIYVTSYSLANIFANRHQYKISANQELLALGAANLISSFAQCYPCSGSLSRSLVQERVGGKTQASSLISVLFVTIFALKFTHLLALLPKSTLAAIIVCALIPSLMKINQLKHFWSISPLDGAVWAVTFCTVTLVGVETGLLIGLALATLHFLIDTFSVRKNMHFEQKCGGHILRIAVTGPLFRWNIKLFDKVFQENIAKHPKENITRVWLDLEKVTLLDDFTILRLQEILCEYNKRTSDEAEKSIVYELIAGNAQNHQRILKHVGLSIRCHQDRIIALNANI